jgi:dipeptidase E
MTIRRILLLSSGSFLADHPQVFEKPFKDLRMVYIPTAAKGSSNMDFVERRRQFFKAENYHYTELDLDGKNAGDLLAVLKDAEIIYVEGGNSFYLLKAVRESGFDTILPELLDAGVIYMGGSAGSYIACPTIEMAKWKHQNKYDHYNVEDLHALALVPFLVSVHYKDEYRELLTEKIAECSLPVRVLTDKQAILVQGNDVQLIGEGEEISLGA